MDKHLRAKVSLKNPWHFAAFGFGAGLIPFMPGTFGSLVAIPLLIAMSYLNDYWFISITVLSFILGIKICQKASDAMGMHDHGSIVWDEIAGMFVTFLFIPISITTLVAGFLLFRLFDILKPWPIRVFDKNVHGGFGIMIDDIVAGAMACICLHLILYYLM
jgi:phosphatidylglycerophosphatase A